MTLNRRTLVALFGAGLLASTPALAADPAAPGRVDGRVTISATGAAAGVGYTWGDGTLTFHGKRYPFSVNGITVADVGFSRIRGTGRVYKLTKLSDFSGTYVGATGQATVVNGIGGQLLQNANGVQIRVDQVTKGARLQGSADGITLTLK